jgi:hypothetical protein
VGDPLMDRALVRTILEHADVQPWKVQDAGLLGLWPQAARELHSSSQVPGTVTLLQFTYVDVPLLTTCRRDGSPWISGSSRPGQPDEIRRITESALALLDQASNRVDRGIEVRH